MDKLLRFEFRKLFGRKVMGILSGLTLGNILFNALFYVSLLSDGAYTVTLSDIVSQVSLIIINNYLSLFAVIFVSLILCDDYSNRTMKNIVSRGYSRISIFFSKYIVT
ncbi:MAG: ABC transporter permease, partial [Eubacteriales bacterium]